MMLTCNCHVQLRHLHCVKFVSRQRRDMHLLSQHGVSIVIIVLLNVIIASCTFPYHIIYDPSYAFMSLLMHMHAIGATEEVMLVELDDDPQGENLEVQHQEVPGEGDPKANHLPKCSDHQPAMFVKSKPRSIISFPILLMSPKLPYCCIM